MFSNDDRLQKDTVLYFVTVRSATTTLTHDSRSSAESVLFFRMVVYLSRVSAPSPPKLHRYNPVLPGTEWAWTIWPPKQAAADKSIIEKSNQSIQAPVEPYFFIIYLSLNRRLNIRSENPDHYSKISWANKDHVPYVDSEQLRLSAKIGGGVTHQKSLF
jgi:hypothetical protein